MSYTRFAIYYTPITGDLATFGARWLGWDLRTSSAVDQPAISGLEEATAAPRKYGFHGTLKPPFRLAEGMTVDALRAAVETLAACVGPGRCDGLDLRRLGRFLALTPQGDSQALAEIAAACVTELDHFRAPPTEAELARRRSVRLTPEQDAHLLRWGYPYVLDQFRFHLTLTGKLDRKSLSVWETHIAKELPGLPKPFEIDAIALAGERQDGQFELIQHYALTG